MSSTAVPAGHSVPAVRVGALSLVFRPLTHLTVPPVTNEVERAGFEAPPVPVEHPLRFEVPVSVPVRVVHLIDRTAPGDAEAGPAAAKAATPPMEPVAAKAANVIREMRERNIYISPLLVVAGRFDPPGRPYNITSGTSIGKWVFIFEDLGSTKN
jgi:hypothetical protein